MHKVVLTGIDDIDNHFTACLHRSLTGSGFTLKLETIIHVESEDIEANVNSLLKFNDLIDIVYFNCLPAIAVSIVTTFQSSLTKKVNLTILDIVRTDDQSILQLVMENSKWYKDLIRFIKMFNVEYNPSNLVTFV